MAEHTPTPWRVEEGTDLIWGACNSDDQSTYGMGYSICAGTTAMYTRGKPSMDEREANAAFIVKACNSHEALVKALQETSAILAASVTADKLSELDDFSFTGKWKHLGRIRVSKVLDDADAALALCEQEGGGRE